MVSFEELKIGDKVRTSKDYSRWCGGAPVEGVVVGKVVVGKKNAYTNLYVIRVQTLTGEVKRLNIGWLDRV